MAEKNLQNEEYSTTDSIADNIFDSKAGAHNNSEKLNMSQSQKVNVIVKLTDLNEHRKEENARWHKINSSSFYGIVSCKREKCSYKATNKGCNQNVAKIGTNKAIANKKSDIYLGEKDYKCYNSIYKS